MNETTIPEEELMEAWNAYVLSCEPKGTCVTEFVSHIPPAVTMEGFQAGVEWHAANHAEEVARKHQEFQEKRQRWGNDLTAKDAEIERLKAVIERLVIGRDGKDTEITKLIHAVNSLDKKLTIVEERLTAAREREEKAFYCLQGHMSYFKEAGTTGGTIPETEEWIAAYDAK